MTAPSLYLPQRRIEYGFYYISPNLNGTDQGLLRKNTFPWYRRHQLGNWLPPFQDRNHFSCSLYLVQKGQTFRLEIRRTYRSHMTSIYDWSIFVNFPDPRSLDPPLGESAQTLGGLGQNQWRGTLPGDLFGKRGHPHLPQEGT